MAEHQRCECVRCVYDRAMIQAIAESIDKHIMELCETVHNTDANQRWLDRMDKQLWPD